MSQSSLWRSYARGDFAAREQLITMHLGLVHHVARRLARTLAVDAEFDELVSVGTIGLLSAIEGFDAQRGLAFSTYAATRIRGAILDELRRQDHATRGVRRKARDIGAARETLMRALGREPRAPELGRQLGVDLTTLWRWQADVEGAMRTSLDAAPTAGETGPSPLEMLSGDDGASTEERLTLEQEVALLRSSIERLPEQERVVLSLYYYEELKLSDIGRVLGVTESRVSQIRGRAIERLRKALGRLRSA